MNSRVARVAFRAPEVNSMATRAKDGFEATPADNAQAPNISVLLPPFERHFTVAEIAGMWNLSGDAVRRLFKKEPGVVVLRGTRPRARKRPYTTLRIPESILARVYSRITISV